MNPLFNPLPHFSVNCSLNNDISNLEEKNLLKNIFAKNMFPEKFPFFQSDEDSNYYFYESVNFPQNENETTYNSKKIANEITLEENNFIENKNFSSCNLIRLINKEDFEKNEESLFLDEEKVINNSILSSLDISPRKNSFNYNFNNNFIPENILSSSDTSKILNYHIKNNDEIKNLNKNLFFEPVNSNNYNYTNDNFLAKKRKNLNNKEKNNLQKKSINSQKVKTFLCECGKVFSTEENKRFHYINVHLHKKPFHCDYCQEEFSHRNGKIYHERVHHTFILPYNCIECNSAFASKSALKYHLKSKHKKV